MHLNKITSMFLDEFIPLPEMIVSLIASIILFCAARNKVQNSQKYLEIHACFSLVFTGDLNSNMRK